MNLPEAAERAERATVMATVVKVLERILKLDLPGVEEDRRLTSDLGLDSSSVLELLMDLEGELAIEFDPDSLEMSHFATIGSLTDYLVASLSEGS